MSDHSSVFRLLALATLLAAFAVSARGGVGGSGAGSQSAAACELDPPRDAAALERCVVISPRDIELMLDLGAIYEADGRGDRAEALYRLALSIDAKDADVHVRLGRLLLGRGDARASAHEAAKALELQPGSSRALKLLQHAERGGTR